MDPVVGVLIIIIWRLDNIINRHPVPAAETIVDRRVSSVLSVVKHTVFFSACIPETETAVEFRHFKNCSLVARQRNESRSMLLLSSPILCTMT